jgi:hypothetical protein
MASTYSDRLKLELMETGANANTWGNNTNINLETLDAFTAGYLSKDVAGSANVTLTTANADPDAESSNKVIEFVGTLTGSIYVFIPAVENNYIFFNNTSGAYTLTIAPTGHAANGVAITQGAHTIMYNNANNEIKDLFAASLGNLSLVSGGVFTGNASGASALNASNVSSGTIADARLTANVTLNNASTISAGTLADARLTANVTLNNASTISAGTLSNDRLDTVPTTKGGTGLTSIGSAGQVLKVATPGSALEFGDAGGGGNYIRRVYTSPATWTKPAGIQAVKVDVWGGGGTGGRGNATPNPGPVGRQGGHGGSGGFSSEYVSEASIPGPVSVTAGPGTNSFGAFLSATGGGTGANAGPGPGTPGSDGTGSGGQLNFPGSYYRFTDEATGTYGFGTGGRPGSGTLGAGANGSPAVGHQQGGGGGSGNPGTAGTGAPGLVIVEEYY